MQRAKTAIIQQSVLKELCELLEGRHPDCQTLAGRFLRDPEFQQASMLLYNAIKAAGRIHACELIEPPPAWLLPA